MANEKPTFSQQMIALVALALVSTAIGVTMKISQVGGQYGYSPASTVVMTEFFKLCVSLTVLLPMISAIENRGSYQYEVTKLFRENVSVRLLRHQFGLAVLYAVVNLVTYSIFVHASASLFFLMKASSPVLTAIILRIFVGRPISSVQWVSIVAQCIGLVTTQYNPCTHSSIISAFGYFLMATNVTVACGAGVWNEHIIKNVGNSVNIQNVVLYSFGILINLAVFFLAPPWMLGVKESFGFFEGYNWKVVSVIVANGSVGLVITAVYKYADVVVKTFGMAGSTMILYLLERVGVLPRGAYGVETGVLVLGAAIVFFASYLYIAAPPAAQASASPVPQDAGEVAPLSVSLMGMLLSSDRRVVVLLFLVFLGVSISNNVECD